MRRTTFTTIATAVLMLASYGRGQQCPDWAPQFDQIQSPKMKQSVESERQTGWDQIFQQQISQGVSLEQQVAQGESLLPSLRESAARARQCVEAVRGGTIGRVSGAQCDNLPQGAGAVMACLCQESIANDTILATQGTIDLMRCRLGGGFHSTPTSVGGNSDEGDHDSSPSAMTPMQRGAASVAGLNMSKRVAMVNSVTNSWQAPSEMSNSATSLSESAALSDPFAEKEVKDESPQTSSDSTAISSEASSDAVTTTQASASLPDLSQRPSSHATQAETIENTAGWTDPLSSDNGSSNPQSASNNDQSYSAPSQHEVSDALTTGLSNANEASATTVATVANAGGWNSFSSGSSSTSGHPPDLHAALGSAGDPAPDAFDEEIDRKVDVVNDLKDKLKDHLPHNDVSDELTDEGIAVVRGVAHQENHILNDAESAMHDSIFGNAPSNGKLNSDIDRLVPTMFESLPAYQQADKIRREALDVQNVVTRTVNSVSCMFSFDPYCK